MYNIVVEISVGVYHPLFKTVCNDSYTFLRIRGTVGKSYSVLTHFKCPFSIFMQYRRASFLVMLKQM